jgi:hypothetical protein
MGEREKYWVGGKPRSQNRELSKTQFFVVLHGEEEVFLIGTKRQRFRWFFFPSKKGILVTLHPKTTSIWAFHLFSRFHLMKGAIL